MGKIIVIDGTSNAGKTTLCENIEKNFQNITIVPGASLFAKIHNEKYPQIPSIPKSIEEEKENQKIFFELELDRLIEANKIAKLGKYVFMDRGVLEILSVAYSFEDIKRWNGIYENAKKLYERFILITRERKIELPCKYIWLQADSGEIVRRNKIRQIERGQKLLENDWIEENLINKQIEFFNKLCIPENKDKMYLIDTNYMTKQQVLKNVCDLFNFKSKER
ncbi:MAG: hypothetical protein IKF97_07000 [Clostridia bacterium]|nr:hypothetical protein [Clostridia bacterium]